MSKGEIKFSGISQWNNLLLQERGCFDVIFFLFFDRINRIAGLAGFSNNKLKES
ncbi:MAG: hypothetical protein LBE18_12675 [Planctomycetaceae bacterium]|nr:hypothetical protein [Planctomycetaceae bacterium]